MFKGFPSEQKANNVKAIAFYAGKMIVGFVEWERCADKAYIVCVKEAFADVRWDVWDIRVFGIASEVYSAKRQDPASQSVFN